MSTARPFGLKQYAVSLKQHQDYCILVTAKSAEQAIEKAIHRSQQVGASKFYSSDFEAVETGA